MQNRKKAMITHGDAFLTLPGGIGTFDELGEVIAAAYMAHNYNGGTSKPVVLLNTQGFFNPVVTFLENAIGQKMIRDTDRQHWHVADTPQDAFDYLVSEEVL
tara:strand:- start:433 stop:738 length:306 start_codon:yes stop_codon:yes gene_type:complete